MKAISTGAADEDRVLNPFVNDVTPRSTNEALDKFAQLSGRGSKKSADWSPLVRFVLPLEIRNEIINR